MSSSSQENEIWLYDPSRAAAAVFLGLYSVICIATITQYFYHKAWFWIFMVIGCIMEVAGYATRIISIGNQQSRPVWIVQYLFILLAPIVMAASCYMCMARIALHVTPKDARNIKTLWIVPRLMTFVFVTFDVVAFLVQILGGVLAVSGTPSTSDLGQTILIVGLALQIAAFGFFLIISFRFHFISRSFRDNGADNTWVTLLGAINMGASMIFLRSVYRMIEYSIGRDGYLERHEWNFFVFDAALILIVTAVFNAVHPGKFLGNPGWALESVEKKVSTSSDVEMNNQMGDMKTGSSCRTHRRHH